MKFDQKIGRVLTTNQRLSWFVYVAHWHSARWAWNGYQPGLGSIPRPGRI